MPESSSGTSTRSGSEPASSAVPWTWVASAAGVGVAVEVAISLGSNRRESWDSDIYWTIGLPAMVVGAFLCALAGRRSAVLTGYAPFAGQLVTMVVRTGGGSMLPLGVIFIAVIGLSGVTAAAVGA